MPKDHLTLQHHAAARDLAAWLAGQRGTGPLKADGGIATLVQVYLDDLTRNALDVLDGKTSAPAAERAHRRLVDDNAEEAYDLGMTDGGADPADKDDTDEEALNGWVVTQDGFVAGLWADVKQLRADRKDLSKDDYAARLRGIMDRIGQWGDSLRNLYSLAKANAQKNKSVTWHYGDTDHCATCQSLNGQRHRLKWFLDKGYIPQENGSDTLDCRGFNCQCHLDDDKGEQVMP